MDGETFITAPSSAPQLKRFFQTYPVEKFQAIAFFKFHEIGHRERQAATQLYRNIVYKHALSLCKPKVTSAMALDWSSGKKTREDYWRQKEKEEEEDSRMWTVQGICVACQFQDYQKSCIDALFAKTILKTEIADAMAIIGVFTPHIPTQRMTACFSRSVLDKTAEAAPLPAPEIDDAAVVEAMRLNDDKASVCALLSNLDDRQRLMFETLLNYLPKKQDHSVSEATFIANYIAPVLRGTLNDDRRITLHFPNTDSLVQKGQGIKPERPDIAVKIRGSEVLYGEVTGPSQEHCDPKNKWDLYRLVRFGKAFLDAGNSFAPLIQVIYTNGTYMRLSVRTRGMFLLEEVGEFMIPTNMVAIPSLLTSLPTLLSMQNDLARLLEDDLNQRRRSWSFDDIRNAKKRIN
ncbi:hypothetical protein BGZ50_006358 [Haplosporangium sp. Z 11]|nr:hypothetical protein BGZ50_006358 [Haplosporangium sp. Z 11]